MREHVRACACLFVCVYVFMLVDAYVCLCMYMCVRYPRLAQAGQVPAAGQWAGRLAAAAVAVAVAPLPQQRPPVLPAACKATAVALVAARGTQAEEGWAAAWARARHAGPGAAQLACLPPVLRTCPAHPTHSAHGCCAPLPQPSLPVAAAAAAAAGAPLPMHYPRPPQLPCPWAAAAAHARLPSADPAVAATGDAPTQAPGWRAPGTSGWPG